MEENKNLEESIESREEQAAKAAVAFAKAMEDMVEKKSGESDEEDKEEEIEGVTGEVIEDTSKDSEKSFEIKDKRDEVIAELNDRIKRNMAEFDNFRKRTDKEKTTMFDFGAKNIIEKILPVIDNFERALATLPTDPEAKAYAEGVDMIYKQLVKNLEDAGLTRIDCVGKEFSPELHNAVLHIEDETLGENIVAEELQKGYMYKDTVVRHSMVKVAN